MPKQSAGLVMYRQRSHGTEILLVHPGGPFWARKDLGAWSIPKGEPEPEENMLHAAIREFGEETGVSATGPFTELGDIRQSGGKLVTAWAFENDWDPAALSSNSCLVEWPPHSGKQLEIPEVDRAEWFTLKEAGRRILKGQMPFLDRLASLLADAAGNTKAP